MVADMLHRISEDRAQGLSRRDSTGLITGLHRVAPGVFSDADEAWARYADLCRSVLGRLQPTAALAGPSAAAMLGVPLMAVPDRVYVRNVPRGRYSRLTVVLPPGDTWLSDNLRLSEPARIAADCARLLTARDTLIVADALLAGDWCTQNDLKQVARNLHRTARIERVRWMAHNANAGSESPGESWARLVLNTLGFDLITQHHVSHDSRQAWLDLLVEGTQVAIEFDGEVKYRRYGPRKVIQEKLRDGDLEALGYRLVHVVWAQLQYPPKLRARLIHAGAQPVRPPVTMQW